MGAGVRDAFPPPMCVGGRTLKSNVVEKVQPPKGVASSLTSLPRVGCVALANPALSKV